MMSNCVFNFMSVLVWVLYDCIWIVSMVHFPHLILQCGKGGMEKSIHRWIFSKDMTWL